MLSDDEIRSALFASGLHHVNRTVITRWKDGIDIDFPTREVIDFARSVERAAYVKAEQVCIETAAELRRCADGCTDGRYDWKADGALDCADAIRALGGQHD